jgi:putative intracellular protease/amidase
MLSAGLSIAFLNPVALTLPRINGARVLFIIGNEFDGTEYSDVKSKLEEQGAIIFTASYEKKKLYDDSNQFSITPNSTFTEVNVSEYEAFFVPGGNSPWNLLQDPRNETVKNLVREGNNEALIMSAICHGPLILSEASIVEGRKGTGHEEAKASWEASGGIWTNNYVERDGNFLTAQYEGLSRFGNADFESDLVSIIAERMARASPSPSPTPIPSPSPSPTPTPAIPEFASSLILPLFMMATLLAGLIYKRKRNH